jgi:hypothetical protein
MAWLAIDNHLKVPCDFDEFLNRGIDALFCGLGSGPQ